MQDNDPEQIQKRVAFYSSLVNAWIQTRMEVDKTLIIISSAGIGFLITLLANKGVTCATALVVYLVAFFCFFATIVLCVLILQRNSSYIRTLLDDPKAKDPLLDTIDRAAKFTFALALIFTLIVGVSTGIDQLYKNKNRKGGQEVAEDKGVSKVVDESAKGPRKVQPAKIEKRSLSGLGELSPSTNTGSTTNTNSGQSSTNQSTEKKK
jgi:hypothetical protein